MFNKGITWASRLIVGGLFIFSGFIKANDIYGFAYKLEDYFAVFGMTFMDPLSMPLAMFICILEIFLGIALLLGVLVTFTINLLMVMIVFFTFLTFYSAFTGAVTDCGCFGDAIPLTPWQSFYKDVILLALIGFLFAQRHLITPFVNISNSRVFLWGLTAFSVLFTFYTTYYLPVWDFRPYKIGNDIYEQTQLPENAQETIYETLFYYKNNTSGEIEEFSLENLPSGEEWSFHDRKDKVIQEGDVPAIVDFSIYDAAGNRVTDEFFNQSGFRLMVVQYNLNASNTRGQDKINSLVRSLSNELDNGNRVWALTSSGEATVERYMFENEVPYDFYTADPIMLKTIVRSNPGLLLLKDNKIIGKWPATAVPEPDKVLSLMQ